MTWLLTLPDSDEFNAGSAYVYRYVDEVFTIYLPLVMRDYP